MAKPKKSSPSPRRGASVDDEERRSLRKVRDERRSEIGGPDDPDDWVKLLGVANEMIADVAAYHRVLSGLRLKQGKAALPFSEHIEADSIRALLGDGMKRTEMLSPEEMAQRFSVDELEGILASYDKLHGEWMQDLRASRIPQRLRKRERVRRATFLNWYKVTREQVGAEPVPHYQRRLAAADATGIAARTLARYLSVDLRGYAADVDPRLYRGPK